MALVVLLTLATLVTMVLVGLNTAGVTRRRAAPLLDPSHGTGAATVLVESPQFALSASPAGNRFGTGWERRREGGREVLVPAAGAARLEAVNLGEEVERTLTLDLLREGLPEGERLSIRTGERELARATLRAAALPLRVRLPEDLPIGLVPIDLVFEKSPGGAGAPSAAPGLLGAGLSPALPPGRAWVEGGDLVQSGNCLVYLRCRLAANLALVGTFVPPAGARSGQRFDLSIERPDGTPIRRFHWLPSFWNRLRGSRRFELPLRDVTGPARVRLISRAGAAGGPPGRWQGLGLVSVGNDILSPGQGQ